MDCLDTIFGHVTIVTIDINVTMFGNGIRENSGGVVNGPEIGPVSHSADIGD
jgi:hypothetical protein